MKKLHIVSNRLPFSITYDEDKPGLEPSVGGLATGMNSVYKDFNGKWIGWPGIASDTKSPIELKQMEALLAKEGCESVHLTEIGRASCRERVGRAVGGGGLR